jgi:RNA polymerase sigma factor (sigma-70 family)
MAADEIARDAAEAERFEACFRRHYADLLAFALRRVEDRQAAEDAVAEIFAVAWRRRELIPEEARPWLFAIGLRVIANQRRSARRRRSLHERLASEAATGPSPEEPAEVLDRRSSFARAFRQLGEEDREVLRLIAWDGLDPRQAARVLGCSYGAFRVRLYRARRRLEKHLEAAGHSAGTEPSQTRPTAEETE